MAFCAACGSPVEGRFCGKCGAAAGTAAPPPPPVYPVAANPGMADNVASALCYALGLITGIIFLVIAPYNQKKNVRFHAFQSIFLHLAAIVLFIAVGIVFGAMGHILGFWMVSMLHSLLWLGFVILWILMMVWTYQGKTIVLPVIGPLAQQQS